MSKPVVDPENFKTFIDPDHINDDGDPVVFRVSVLGSDGIVAFQVPVSIPRKNCEGEHAWSDSEMKVVIKNRVRQEILKRASGKPLPSKLKFSFLENGAV